MKWKFILLSVVIFFSGCAKNVADKNNDLGNGNKSNLPVSLDALIEHAEYCNCLLYTSDAADE